MLRVLAYIWAFFGAYWIVFAPAFSSKSLRQSNLQTLKLGFLAVTFMLLVWKAQSISPVWIVVLGFAWTMVALYWVAPRKETHSGEYRFYRLLRLLIGALTFALLFWQKTGIGFLGQRFLPRNFAVMVMGFVVTLFGLGVTAWARVHLGQYWSDKVVIQPEHRLVRTGPYARVRHPIYFGVLLAIAGTTLVVGEWRALTSLLLMSINYMVKARKEDKILSQCFGEEFRSYQQNAGMLLPHFGPRPTNRQST